MMNSMIAAAALVLATSLATAAGAQNTPTRGPQHVTAAQLRAYVAVTKDGLVTHSAVSDPASNTLVVRRVQSGEVERHARMNDVMMVEAGEASIILGGRVEGGHETAPGEWRGGTIVGGHTQPLRPGDVLWIPAGVPHLMVLKPKASFTYLVVKTELR